MARKRNTDQLMPESHGMTRRESVAKTHDKYMMALALLQSWEKDANAEPEYISYLQKRVRYFHGQLVNKGAICPNET